MHVMQVETFILVIQGRKYLRGVRYGRGEKKELLVNGLSR